MYEGRFSAFHDDLVSNATEQMSVNIVPDVHLLMLCTAFAVPYFAFLFILPGIREHRFASFLTVTITFTVGFILLGAMLHPGWNSGTARVLSQFHAHSPQRVEAMVGAHIGLYSLNITMNHISSIESSTRHFEGVHFNEKFDISSVGSMGDELQMAYRKGLPYPMLKLLEYFSLNEASFDWGRKYRLAGHYAGASLWMGFAFWIIQVIILCVVPHNYAKIAIASGIFILNGALVYAFLCPRQLNILFTGVSGNITVLEMHYGICFFATLFAGFLNALFGSVLCLLQFSKIYTLSTFLDASMDEHVAPSRVKRLSTMRSVDSSGNLSSLSFMKTMKSLQCIDQGLSPCFNVASSGFYSTSFDSPRSYRSHSPSDETNRRKSSNASLETLSQPSDFIVNHF
uniref:DUOXA-like protein n=1 Tax=Parascaris univalens TaxID=6257 RepID=A0A915B388_PARUN